MLGQNQCVRYKKNLILGYIMSSRNEFLSTGDEVVVPHRQSAE
jgi:hypothetical protein